MTGSRDEEFQEHLPDGCDRKCIGHVCGILSCDNGIAIIQLTGNRHVDSEGRVHVTGLIDIPPGTRVVVNAFDGRESHSLVVTTR